MGFCALVAFYFSIRGFQSNYNAWKWHILAGIFCVLGMGSKEVMVGIPLLIFIYDVIFIHERWMEAIKSSKTLYFGLAISWLAMGVLVYSGRTSDAVILEKGTFFQLVSTQAQILFHYLFLTFYPFNLCFDYRWPVGEFWGCGNSV